MMSVPQPANGSQAAPLMARIEVFADGKITWTGPIFSDQIIMRGWLEVIRDSIIKATTEPKLVQSP